MTNQYHTNQMIEFAKFVYLEATGNQLSDEDAKQMLNDYQD